MCNIIVYTQGTTTINKNEESSSVACMPCATPPAHMRLPQGLALAGAADAQQGEAAADDDGAAEAAACVQAWVGVHYSLCRGDIM